MNLATLTDSGRAALAMAIAAQPLHLAWGAGDAAWDDDSEQIHLKTSLRQESALLNEIGRRTISVTAFVTPDDNGELVVPRGLLSNGDVEVLRYDISNEPTPNLYLKVAFDFADAATEIIREVGIFIGAKPQPELPPGQRYFTPSQLADHGTLLAIQRLEPVITRSPAVRHEFEFVLPI